MSDVEMGGLFDAQVPGVTDRVNGSPYYITKVPDLIGILDRKYIDHTATHQHRGSGDLMRYAALVECCDSMDFGSHRMLSDVQRRIHASAGRTRCCMRSRSISTRSSLRPIRTRGTNCRRRVRRSSHKQGAPAVTPRPCTPITS